MTNVELVKKIQATYLNPNVKDEFNTGMEVEVHLKVKEGENKVRIQKFKGIIIKTGGKTALEKTITVRKKVGPFGVERIFPIHSPSVDKIDIIRQFKVRHKYIKFVKNLSGRAARLKEIRPETAKQKSEAAAPKKETKKKQDSTES